MKKTVAALAAFSLLSVATSQAFSVSLFSFTGDPARVDVTVSEVGAGDLQIDLLFVAGPPGVGDADISGFFADLSDESLIGGLSVVGADVTGEQFGPANGVTNLGGGVVITPASGFDIGIKIGANGNDDIESTSFVLSHDSVDLTLALLEGERLGARLKSTDGDEGSSKLVSGRTPPPPPKKVDSTGSTIAFLGMGLAALAGLRRRMAR